MKMLNIFGLILGGLIGIVFIGLVILGNMAPETSVYLGHQIPKKYLSEIRSLGLLGENDNIKYFYTDTVFDIKESLYFVTDKNLVLYCQQWEEPETIIAYSQIPRCKEATGKTNT